MHMRTCIYMSQVFIASAVLQRRICGKSRRSYPTANQLVQQMSSTRLTALCVYDSVIRGHHVYKAIWTPAVGEVLLVRKEPANTHDRKAVAIISLEETIVGHVPREIAKIFWHFLNHGGTIACEVSGHRRQGNGLEIPCQYRLQGEEKIVRKAKQLLKK